MPMLIVYGDTLIGSSPDIGIQKYMENLYKHPRSVHFYYSKIDQDMYRVTLLVAQNLAAS